MTTATQQYAAPQPARRGRRDPREVARFVRSAAAGDEAAWNELVDEFAGLVWGIARAHRLSPADAADVSQQTWLGLLEHLDTINAPERVGAWLATTARRHSLRIVRAGQRTIPSSDAIPEAVSPLEPDSDLVAQQRNAALWAAYRRLPQRDQRLLTLMMSDREPSYQELSAALEMPIGSIGPTRGRALERLRRELAQDGFASAQEL
jgi:RNA polymerase sigma factor (sigma-70 family)